MVFKWKEQHTPLFLNYFKNYPCLWDFKNEGYKNREMRAHATKCLIQDLDLDGVTREDIKLKIKSIRTRYTCELSKIKRSIQNGCSPDDTYVPKLFWFKQADEFLNAVCIPRESSSLSNLSIAEKQLQVTISESTEEDRPDTPLAKDPLAETSSASKTRKRCNDSPIKIEKKQQKTELNQINISTVTEDNKGISENEFDLFCRSLAVQLKNMPLHRALICQQDLLAVMVQERLQSMATSSRSDSTFNSVDR